MAKRYVQIPTAYLSGSGVVLGATSITINAFTDIYGNNLTMTDFGDSGYATVEPDTTNEESFTFTSITANANGTVTLGGIKTSLAKDPYTETSGLVRSHVGGSKVVVSDTAAFWATFANKNNDETIQGLWTFNQNPAGLNPGAITDASTTAIGIARSSSSSNISLGTVTVTIASPGVFTLNNHGLTVNDRVQLTTTGSLPTGLTPSTTYYIISSGLTANNFQVSASQGGSAVNTSGTQSGTHTLIKTTPIFITPTDYRISSYGVDSGTANAHIVTLPNNSPTSYSGGQTFSYQVAASNTAAVTTNIAGLGAKTIKKWNGTTDLVAGDLIAGQLIEIEYNQTSGFFVLLSPVANPPSYNTYFGDGSDGNVTISVNTNLTRDMYYNNLTINNGIVLSNKGFRIYVAGTLTQVGTGKIDNSGSNGSVGGNATGTTQGTGGAGGVGGATGNLMVAIDGKVGGLGGLAGGTVSGAHPGQPGAAGAAGAASKASITNGTPTSIAGAQGGSGGISDIGGGGAGGTVGAAGTVVSSGIKILTTPFNPQWTVINGVAYNLDFNAGTGASTGGGGGGGSNGAGNGGSGGGGGGGGGNGGEILIYASSIVTANNPIASATGGNGNTGGNGGNAAYANGGGGGGGAGGSGGSGGLIIVYYKVLSGSLTGTVTGGTGGAGGTGGTKLGTGTNGATGNTGNTGAAGLFLSIAL